MSNGQAAAVTFARAGASVACMDLDASAAEHVAQQITDEGGSALAIQADVTSESDIVKAYAEIAATWEPPTAVHNNVGVAMAGEITTLEPEEWNKGIAVNLTSCYSTIRHALPAMLDRGKGAIVNVSSTASIRDMGYVYPVYNATKAAVNQLTVSLALTYAKRGIRVNAVLPGLIDTPIGRAFVSGRGDLDAQLSARHAASPTGQMGSPWDIAHAAQFLLSDRAAYVNAVSLPVDGGLTARCM
ncbi:SDR family NAD(P)-dependent oxidoreductase [Rhodococcus indonesiensis]|uniref:SDR family NAD(P)-dependent oxidoreductase n=1 Tax=Rhodococcus indonesiensis TaxID=3055869 RepID=UPI0039F70144